MKTFKKLHFLSGIAKVVMSVIIAISGSLTPVMANDIDVMKLPDEELNYKVLYKWGLIQKQAGIAKLKLRGNDTHYVATLVGHLAMG